MMVNTDFIRAGDFAWFLRIMMEMADIRPKELAEAAHVPVSIIYHIRSAYTTPSWEVQERLLDAIERWRPGTLAMMRAAEDARKKGTRI